MALPGGVALGVGILALFVAGIAAAEGGAQDAADTEVIEPEVVDLVPDQPADWSMRYVFAPIQSIFYGGTKHLYQPREVTINSTPSGGLVDLFYVRSNFQKRYEQAETPVIVRLPSRLDAGPRDSLTIRAFAEGYRPQEVTMPIRSKQDVINIDLEPLPNTLDGVAHRYFAGRSAISFLTKEALTFRLQEAEDGFSVILTETAISEAAQASALGIRSPLVEEVFDQQLGVDLMVRVILTEEAIGKIDVRSRQSFDAARELYVFTIDLVPSDGGAEAIERALDALAEISESDVSGCALSYDDALREQLDAGALSRALVPHGDFTDPYLRAAMRRQGEIAPGGVVNFLDGSSYRPSVPIELEMSLNQAGQARGYLALLRRFVAAVESGDHARETFRSLIAPELDTEAFGEIVDRAEAAEASCRDRG